MGNIQLFFFILWQVHQYFTFTLHQTVDLLTSRQSVLFDEKSKSKQIAYDSINSKILSSTKRLLKCHHHHFYCQTRANIDWLILRGHVRWAKRRRFNFFIFFFLFVIFLFFLFDAQKMVTILRLIDCIDDYLTSLSGQPD